MEPVAWKKSGDGWSESILPVQRWLRPKADGGAGHKKAAANALGKNV